MTINKILIADDEAQNRILYKMIFQKEFPDFELEAYEDGTSLENRINGNADDVGVIVSDNSMPGIDGSEIIERYATRLRFKDIPFILCYGSAEKDIGETALKNGAFAYVMKPIKDNKDQLVDTVRRALGGK